jgi:hypothetical protein
MGYNVIDLDDEDDEEMEMPCPCQKCGEIFDLHDGRGSDKWFPGTVICTPCSNKEELEIEDDEEIEELERAIEDAEHTLKHSREALEKLKAIVALRD